MLCVRLCEAGFSLVVVCWDNIQGAVLETQQPLNLSFKISRVNCVDLCYHAPLPTRYPLSCSLPLRGDAFGAKLQPASSSSSRTVWHPLTPAPPSSAHMKKEFYFFNVINYSYFHLNQLFSFIEVNVTVLACDLLLVIIIGTRINILL